MRLQHGLPPRAIHDLAVQVLDQKRDVRDAGASAHHFKQRLDVLFLGTAHVAVRGLFHRDADVLRG